MEFRRLTPQDLDEAHAFAIAGLRPELYPMRLDPDKIRGALQHFMASTSDFHLAAVSQKRIVGGIAAAVYESPWFERCDATVVMFRAIQPGVGASLLAALRAWVDASMRIRRVLMPLEFDARRGMARLARRYGFTRTQLVCAFEKD